MLRRNILKATITGGIYLNNKYSYCSYDKTIMKENFNKTMTGSEFKQKFPNYIPVKFIGENYNNFQYVIGKNTDNLPFNPTNQCESGGLYFTDIDNLMDF